MQENITITFEHSWRLTANNVWSSNFEETAILARTVLSNKHKYKSQNPEGAVNPFKYQINLL